VFWVRVFLGGFFFMCGNGSKGDRERGGRKGGGGGGGGEGGGGHVREKTHRTSYRREERDPRENRMR